MPRYTWEIFRIYALANEREISSAIPAYRLEDLKGEKIVDAIFYEPELSYVHPNQNKIYAIREILEQKGDKIKVWWQGEQRKDATWISRSQLATK